MKPWPGAGLFTEEHDEDDGTTQDWEAYLDKLHTLMLAYSIAGPLPSLEDLHLLLRKR